MGHCTPHKMLIPHHVAVGKTRHLLLHGCKDNIKGGSMYVFFRLSLTKIAPKAIYSPFYEFVYAFQVGLECKKKAIILHFERFALPL